MDDIRDIEQRMQCWIRDFGHEKQPIFIADLKILLHELERLRVEIKTTGGVDSDRKDWPAREEPVNS